VPTSVVIVALPPIVIVTPNGQQELVDTSPSFVGTVEPIRLGFINNNHYVSISKEKVSEEFQDSSLTSSFEPMSSVSEELEIQPYEPARACGKKLEDNKYMPTKYQLQENV